VFEGNTHEQSDAYPPSRMAASPVLLEHCSQASITLETEGTPMPPDEERVDTL
jgi:hypothetical protein